MNVKHIFLVKRVGAIYTFVKPIFPTYNLTPVFNSDVTVGTSIGILIILLSTVVVELKKRTKTISTWKSQLQKNK